MRRRSRREVGSHFSDLRYELCLCVARSLRDLEAESLESWSESLELLLGASFSERLRFQTLAWSTAAGPPPSAAKHSLSCNDVLGRGGMLGRAGKDHALHLGARTNELFPPQTSTAGIGVTRPGEPTRSYRQAGAVYPWPQALGWLK